MVAILREADKAPVPEAARKQKVMLASDLAALYGVQTKALVQAVKRNLERFPSDFAYAIRELMTPPAPTPERRIGFVQGE